MKKILYTIWLLIISFSSLYSQSTILGLNGGALFPQDTETGMIVGGSSGLNLTAAMEISKNCPEHSTLVTVLCDSGIKYLSTIYK